MAAPKRTSQTQMDSSLAKILAVLEARTKLLAFFLGLCFVTALLVLAICFPDPTAFQYTVFRIVLALAAAGVAGVIPGMIRLKVQPGTALLIHAGGALAVFVMVYLLAPAALKPEEKPVLPSPSQQKKAEKKVPAAQSLKIRGMDTIETHVHLVNTAPSESAASLQEQPTFLSPLSKAVPVAPQARKIIDVSSYVKNVQTTQRSTKINNSITDNMLYRLKISGSDKIEHNVHIVSFKPPRAVRFIRLINTDKQLINILLTGFPDQYFYTDLTHENLEINSHEDKQMYIVLMPNLPEKKEYLFDIEDNYGTATKMKIRLEDGWDKYFSEQIQRLRDKNRHGASEQEL